MRFEYDLDELNLDSEGYGRLAFTVSGDLGGEAFVLHSHFHVDVEVLRNSEEYYAKVRVHENEDDAHMHVHAPTLDLVRVLEDFMNTKAYAAAIEREIDSICSAGSDIPAVGDYLKEKAECLSDTEAYNRNPYAYYGLSPSDFY